MRFAATCNYGLSSVLKSEILRLGFPIVESTERIVRFSGEFSDMVRANLSLRTANRVYLECAEGPTADFDALFELASDVPWKQFLPPIRPTEIRAVSEKSQLDSLPAIQKTVKKAIAVNLTGKTNGILLKIRPFSGFGARAHTR
jgi:23S rRNA G2445 N2-methylase RlmL